MPYVSQAPHAYEDPLLRPSDPFPRLTFLEGIRHVENTCEEAEHHAHSDEEPQEHFAEGVCVRDQPANANGGAKVS